MAVEPYPHVCFEDSEDQPRHGGDLHADEGAEEGADETEKVAKERDGLGNEEAEGGVDADASEPDGPVLPSGVGEVLAPAQESDKDAFGGCR